MNINIFFNPYPTVLKDKESAKTCLLSTARLFREFIEKIGIGKVYNIQGESAISSFKMYIAHYGNEKFPGYITQLIPEFDREEKALVMFFYRGIDKGLPLTKDVFSDCKNLILKGLNSSFPVLEYALRQKGVVVTISDDDRWRCNFFYFIDTPEELPNIYGQNDSSHLFTWVRSWKEQNLKFEDVLSDMFGAVIIPSAWHTISLNKEDKKEIIKSFEKKKNTNFSVDNNIIKSFSTKYGNILELRCYGDGIRVFFLIKDCKLIISGFYKKNCGNQQKAGEEAGKRLKKEGYF